MAIETIPATVEEITPHWLTQALRSTGVIKNATVTSAYKDDKAFGGITGSLARLLLSYDQDEEGAPQSLIAKLPASDPSRRVSYSSLGSYENMYVSIQKAYSFA